MLLANRAGEARRPLFFLAVLILATLASAAVSLATEPARERIIRVATYNASLNRPAADQLLDELRRGDHPQIAAVAAILQNIDADIVFINEFDFDATLESAQRFRQTYLGVSQRGQTPLRYEYAFTAPVNTGVPSGFDLNNDGRISGGEDAFGYGDFPGQYGMLLLSKHAIDVIKLRTFRNFLWQDMPDAKWPEGDWYSAAERAAMRLSSKSHWDVPITVGGQSLHLLLSHPTPPTFDGPEDRNGRRNHDEIRFWRDYLSPGQQSAYIYDDAQRRGGLDASRDSRFVLLGDLNADPYDGDSFGKAIRPLLTHPRVNAQARETRAPASHGAVQASATQGGANTTHNGPARLDTADFNDGGVGNLRIDYVLPSANIAICNSGVFWPAPNDSDVTLLTTTAGQRVSDHHLVWMDLAISGRCPPRYRKRKSTPTGQ